MFDRLDRSRTDVVLIVDDVPDNLSLLHDALDDAGYTVLVATNGEAALQRALQAVPDVILLDAIMPGVDYVVKPIRPREVLARIASHIQGARQARQARNALDAFGHASITVRISDGRILWQTPLARKLLQSHFDAPEAVAPVELAEWLQQTAPKLSAEIAQGLTSGTVPVWAVNQGGRRLSFTLHQPTGEDEWLLVMQESSDQAAMDALSQEFKLTTREGEVLYWVVKDKTNRDIGDILGSSPATVKKQLEHIFAKLGVETRTAAAGLGMGRVGQLKARWGGLGRRLSSAWQAVPSLADRARASATSRAAPAPWPLASSAPSRVRCACSR